MGISRLERTHSGGKVSFGSSALSALAGTLVEIDLASESDWTAAGKLPSTLVDCVLRRFLSDRGQQSLYSDSGTDANGQLFLVLNTESSFAMGAGDAIADLEAVHPGMGAAFYDTLRHGLGRWLRVYDDYDARDRIEQMTEWAEGEDSDSYEIPKLEPDLPPCLQVRKRTEVAPPLQSFAPPADPSLNELVATTIELHQVSRSIERPALDADFLDQEREFHSLDSPLPSVLLYFHAGDAVTACFDNECEYWGQETPEPNLIIPIRRDDPNSVRQALAAVATLMRVLVLTVEISKIIEAREKFKCDSVSTSEANLS